MRPATKVRPRVVVSLVSAILAPACADLGSAGSSPVSAARDGGALADASVPPATLADAAPVGALEDGSDAPPPGVASEGGILDARSDAAAPTCGAPPARYTLLAGADTGLARDNATSLVWMRDSHGAGEPPQTQPDAAAYCTGRGMRLPTKDEALALAAGYAACAFGPWGTWTSTPAAGAGDAWVVDYTGSASPQLAINFPSAVLCARDGTKD